MTDKQIIIDVNKCKYRDTYTNFCKAEKDDVGECYTICTGNDCYYKQLKRKEQECERLNEYSVGFARKCQKLELDVCHLKDKNYNLQRRLDQLKTTLTEIKDIAEEEVHTRMLFADKKSFCDFNKILQKISECEVE